MNRSETAAVIAYLNRAGLVGALEGQTVVWAEALADLDVADVQPAVREIVRTRTSAERWVTPGDVRKVVVKAQAQSTGTDLATLNPWWFS